MCRNEYKYSRTGGIKGKIEKAIWQIAYALSSLLHTV